MGRRLDIAGLHERSEVAQESVFCLFHFPENDAWPTPALTPEAEFHGALHNLATLLAFEV